jgi:hypothetical protein
MARPISFMNYTLNDNTINPKNNKPESTSLRLPITTVTSGNIVAVTGLVLDLETAINAITLGNPAKTAIIADEHGLSDAAASTTSAQRENKWLFRFHDAVTVTDKARASIGTADFTFLVNHTEYIDITADEGLALKIAFEAVVKSPYDGSHGVVLDSVQFVGRNT